MKHLNTENKDKQIYFLCAMPRSGNTLFASLMNQNPDIAVTANSITLEIMKNRQNTLTPGSSQPEVFNVLGQMQTIERVEEERKALSHEKKKAISETPKYGKQG